MKKSKWGQRLNGVPCLIILFVIFGYMSYVMGLTNMLNTMMKTAHDLLLNTVFYLMGMCVLTGALGKILVEFGVVDLLQKLLKPIMKPLFNMPGVASLGAVLTFLSDNPAIIALSQDKGFAQYFKRYQHVSLVNFGTAFGMGLLVIIFMIGHGYFSEPFIGFIGAMCGCIVSTRLMQYLTCRQYPIYRTADAITVEDMKAVKAESNANDDNQRETSTFIRVLNALLDGGKSGVDIGLAIIPGVLIISTFVMMMTFGGTVEGQDSMGRDIIVYTGGAYQGTQLLPWLAGKISFVFEWLFGFTAPELVAFPITALGAVGAALGLIPEFINKGIIDGNAIAVFTAMGMCWSGYLSTDAATLDRLGYRSLVPKAFLSTFIGGICAGIVAHWLCVLITFVSTMLTPQPVWQTEASAWGIKPASVKVQLEQFENNTYKVKDWFGVEGSDLQFTVNSKDSSITVVNAYAQKLNQYYFVHIDPKLKHGGEVAYACVYTPKGYSRFVGNKQKGHFYCFAWLYDMKNRMLNGGYYEVTWGGEKRATSQAVLESMSKKVDLQVDSVNSHQTVARDTVKAN